MDFHLQSKGLSSATSSCRGAGIAKLKEKIDDWDIIFEDSLTGNLSIMLK
jgi:hypothetical protein